MAFTIFMGENYRSKGLYMIQLHHLNNSRSQRILWMLEELELPYEIIRHERDKETNLAPGSLKKVHPLGKSPVVVDGENTLAESGAVIEYLASKYGKGAWIPKEDSPAFLQYKYWLHYAEGTLMPFLVLKLILSKIENVPLLFFIKPIIKIITGKVEDSYLRANIVNNLGFIEQHLAQREWFAGDRISAADIQMSFPLEAGASRFSEYGNFPQVMAYVKRVHERPAYKRALEAGGDYDYA